MAANRLPLGAQRGRPGQEAKKYAKVLYNYTAAYEDELSLRHNDVVVIISQSSSAGSGWAEARLRGKVGKIPDNYIEPIDEPKGRKARAVWDHNDEDGTGTYISFQTGDIITVLQQEDSGWWLGYFNEQIGRFPYNYVEIIPEESPSAATSTAKSYYDLIQLLSEPRIDLIRSLALVADPTISEQLAKDLVAIFEANGQALELVNKMIKHEVDITTSSGTLFRGNSLASHLMVSYARSSGKQYLVSTLKPLIELIRSSETSFEVDPSKLKSGESLSENTKNLSSITSSFIDRIVKSLDSCPITIRAICKYLQKVVSAKFPESKSKSVGGFFFLRILCPAIVSPDGFNIVNRQIVTPEIRRALILVSKILQNIANAVQFGQKETYMIPFNQLCASQTTVVQSFFDSLANVSDDVSEPVIKISEADLFTFAGKVHLTISTHLPKLEAKMKELQLTGSLEQLLDLLKALPPPSNSASGPRTNTVETPYEDRRKSAVFVLNNFLQTRRDSVALPPGVVASIVSSATSTSTPGTTSTSATTLGTTSTSASNGTPVPTGNTSAPAANENYTVLNGWLHKKGARGMVKGFKKRWFSLQKDARLVYYEAQDEAKEKGHIDIRKVNSIAPCGAFGKQPRVTTFEFRIKTATREYILVALNEKDMWYWINGLNSVRQKNLLKSMNLTTSGERVGGSE
eukprot:TRINITY_DN1288_c0_g1_i1.p1 TRINITY_DN1288_c0_g1~~TRINITY_DN1288_c0_g1_i1.p1  ORF type:complete len:687 (+),score=116.19 TRINITY_DN1288_c0_g1_i1:437-2497(+)